MSRPRRWRYFTSHTQFWPVASLHIRPSITSTGRAKMTLVACWSANFRCSSNNVVNQTLLSLHVFSFVVATARPASFMSAMGRVKDGVADEAGLRENPQLLLFLLLVLLELMKFHRNLSKEHRLSLILSILPLQHSYIEEEQGTGY
jgi:hypothetical protein